MNENLILQALELGARLLIDFLNAVGYWGPFLAMAIESACIPISSEVVLLFMGYLVSKGEFDLVLAAASGAAGFSLGSLLPFFLGRRYGESVMEFGGRILFIKRTDLDRVNGWFRRYGHNAILMTRCIPVVRDFISFPAGMSKMPLAKFMLFTFIGAFPWALGVIWLGSLVGARWKNLLGYFDTWSAIILGLAGSTIGILVIRSLWIRIRIALNDKRS